MNEKHTIVTTVEQYMAATDRRLLLAGDLVFCSMIGQPELPDCIPLPAMFVQSGLAPRLRMNSPRLYLAVNSVVTSKPGTKVGLAIEGYLKWGFRQQGPHTRILIGGGEGRNEQNLVVCVFSHGQLIGVEERQLPLASSFDWADSIKALHESLLGSYPAASFYQAGPIADWGLAGFEYIGNEPFDRLHFRSSRYGGVSPALVLAPLGMLSVGLLGYAIGAGYGYYLYSDKVDEYKAAANNPVIVKHGGLDEGALAVLEKKEALLKNPSPLAKLMPEATKLIGQLSDDSGTSLLELRLPASARAAGTNPNPEDPQFLITVSAKSTSGTFLDQAASVMGKISNRTGYTLRLVSRIDGGGEGVRTFKLEALPSTTSATGTKP